MLNCTSSQEVNVANRAFLGIGELGRRTGLATSALRYYERVGLLTPDGRANGRRYYGPASAEQIALIRLCQDAGFTLAEVRAFVAAGSRRSSSWTRLMETKRLELEASIVRAKQAKALIEHGLACRHRELSMCPTFRAALESRLSPPAADSVHAMSARHRSRAPVATAKVHSS
jgi:DNA-binding transcriptional MerR regulator